MTSSDDVVSGPPPARNEETRRSWERVRAQFTDISNAYDRIGEAARAYQAPQIHGIDWYNTTSVENPNRPGEWTFTSPGDDADGRAGAEGRIRQALTNVADDVQYDPMAEQLTIPMDGLEEVDVEQIKAVLANRRTVQAFGKLLHALDMGRIGADSDFEALMERAIFMVNGLKQAVTDAQRRSLYLEQQADARVDSATGHLYAHHVQWRILDMEDGILEASEWVPDYKRDIAKTEMEAHLSDWQLQGKDVYLAEYNNCEWVNLTTKRDREGGGRIGEHDF